MRCSRSRTGQLLRTTQDAEQQAFPPPCPPCRLGLACANGRSGRDARDKISRSYVESGGALAPLGGRPRYDRSMTNETKQAFDELSLPEQIRLVQDLWDRIACRGKEVVPSRAQIRELERRLRSYEMNPPECETWEDLRQRLERRSQ